MPFEPKTWKDRPLLETPLDAAGLNDLELRIYTAINEAGALDPDTEAALAGTDGTPSDTNRFVTESDLDNHEQATSAHGAVHDAGSGSSGYRYASPGGTVGAGSYATAVGDDSRATNGGTTGLGAATRTGTNGTAVGAQASASSSAVALGRSAAASGSGNPVAIGRDAVADADDRIVFRSDEVIQKVTSDGEVMVSTDGGTSFTDLVADDDARLSDARAPTSHSHAIGDVTNLQSSLDGKAATSHSHAPADITGGSDGQVLTRVSGATAWADPSGSELGPGDVSPEHLNWLEGDPEEPVFMSAVPADGENPSGFTGITGPDFVGLVQSVGGGGGAFEGIVTYSAGRTLTSDDARKVICLTHGSGAATLLIPDGWMEPGEVAYVIRAGAGTVHIEAQSSANINNWANAALVTTTGIGAVAYGGGLVLCVASDTYIVHGLSAAPPPPTGP